MTEAPPGLCMSGSKRQPECIAWIPHVTLRGNQSGLRLPPKAARTAGPPGTRLGRWINRAKRIHSAWPLHSPSRGQSAAVLAADWPHEGYDQREQTIWQSRGTPVARVDLTVGPWRMVRAGQELRSLPAKQHAPKARPHPATDRGRRPAPTAASGGHPAGQGGRGVRSHHVRALQALPVRQRRGSGCVPGWPGRKSARAPGSVGARAAGWAGAGPTPPAPRR